MSRRGALLRPIFWGFMLLVSVCSLAPPASAAVQRFALIAGNNRGHGGDAVLRYAQSDAARLAQVLRELGGFEPADIVLLQSEDANTLRRTLIALNDRIRSAQALPNTETLLLVYYSGHADGRALRLGNTKLDLRELAQLVRGSSAKFRLLILDACRSGALTRVKGGRVIAPFTIDDPGLGSEGLALLTAASATEDAQESDELQGSFFTHALVSGLLGAADRNGDGEVALEEAYQYAYHGTLAATSRTFSGVQHPTFQYELKGQGGLVLTWPAWGRGRRAQLVFPKGIDFLVLSGTEQGQVLGEVTAFGAARTLSVAPGRYFLRGRAADHLLEGVVAVTSGARYQVEANELERVAYARLVRKGASEAGVAMAIEAEAVYRASFAESLESCAGMALGYRVDFPDVGFGARLGVHTRETQNATLRRRSYDYEIAAEIDHTWDAGGWSLAFGAGAGARVVHQTFETRATAPDRFALAPLALLMVTPTVALGGRLYLGLDLRLQGYFQHYQATAVEREELRAPLALSAGALFGAHL